MPPKTQSSPPSQQGFTLGSLVITLVVLAVVLGLGARLFPVYSEHRTVLSVTRSVLDSSDTTDMSRNAIRQEINQGLRINGVRNFDLERIGISRAEGSLNGRLRYEERVPLIYNIDLIVSFDDRIE